jgi:hypothetical protein
MISYTVLLEAEAELFVPDVSVELEVGEQNLLTDGALVLAPVVPLLPFIIMNRSLNSPTPSVLDPKLSGAGPDPDSNLFSLKWTGPGYESATENRLDRDQINF